MLFWADVLDIAMQRITKQMISRAHSIQSNSGIWSVEHTFNNTPFNTQILQTDLIVGSKFTIFALFYFVFEGNFPSTNPWGAYIWRGDLTEGFLSYQFGGLIFGGAYSWKGLFSEFYGISIKMEMKLGGTRQMQPQYQDRRDKLR